MECITNISKVGTLEYEMFNRSVTDMIIFCTKGAYMCVDGMSNRKSSSQEMLLARHVL